MKQKTLFLILLLVPLLMFGQTRKHLRTYKKGVKAQREMIQAGGEGFAPSAYLEAFERAAEEGEQLLREGYDIVIDPIESINFAASYVDVKAGSWGEDYLGINRRRAEIKSRAERKVIVFIFDTGAWDHPALEPVSWHPKDRMFTGEDSNLDKHSHSTHCAGIVAGADGDGLDPLAEAGKIALISYKVLSNTGGGLFSWIETGIREANKEAAALIRGGDFVVYSFSLGSPSYSASVNAALKEAKELGVYIAAASGNTGAEGVNFPGSSEHVHGVGAIQQDGSGVKKANYSTTGAELDISEPGSSILSTVLNGGYAFKSGTSMATPHQARLAAIVASIYPKATAEEVRAHLVKYATDLPPSGWDKETGAGWDVVDKLLDNPIGDTPPPPPPPDPDPDPDPDPPTDPEPPKATRVYTAEFPWISEVYSVRWKAADDAEHSTLYFRLTVSAKFKEDAEDFARRLDEETNRHFRSRTYFLRRGSDYWDAAFWVAYFYELILRKQEGIDTEVLQIEAYNEEGLPVILGEKELKKQRGLSRLVLNAVGVSSTEK